MGRKIAQLLAVVVFAGLAAANLWMLWATLDIAPLWGVAVFLAAGGFLAAMSVYSLCLLFRHTGVAPTPIT